MLIIFQIEIIAKIVYRVCILAKRTRAHIYTYIVSISFYIYNVYMLLNLIKRSKDIRNLFIFILYYYILKI